MIFRSTEALTFGKDLPLPVLIHGLFSSNFKREASNTDELKSAREKLDVIDGQIAKLFCERMDICRGIGEFKANNGLPIEDKSREVELIGRNSASVPEELRPYYRRFLSSLVSESKKYQSDFAKDLPDAERGLFVSLGERSYKVTVGEGTFECAGKLFNLDRKVFILTDSGVPEEYSARLALLCREPHIFTVSEGENSKNPDTYLSILSELHKYGFERTDCLITVGGGVVGDLGGFTAATYLRGIDFYNVPTTLLAAVDSSVGGKTAVNFGDTKNSVGAFYQPKGVIVDPNLLKSLPGRQFSSGMAEVIKMFAVCDRESFEKLESDGFSDVSEIILAALRIKIKIVEEDEKESGIRKLLNFGHTVGHGIESTEAKSENPLLHGECVGLGMLCMSRGDARTRIERLLVRYSLPTGYSGKENALRYGISHDKKSVGGKVSAVTLDAIGQYGFEKLTVSEIIERSREVLKLS